MALDLWEQKKECLTYFQPEVLRIIPGIERSLENCLLDRECSRMMEKWFLFPFLCVLQLCGLLEGGKVSPKPLTTILYSFRDSKAMSISCYSINLEKSNIFPSGFPLKKRKFLFLSRLRRAMAVP